MLTLSIYLFWRIDIPKDYKIFSYTALNKTRQNGFVDNRPSTLCHTDSFIGLAVPHLRLFLISTMMPLDRCVATGNDLTVLLGKWDLKYTFCVDITRALLKWGVLKKTRLFIHIHICQNVDKGFIGQFWHFKAYLVVFGLFWTKTE